MLRREFGGNPGSDPSARSEQGDDFHMPGAADGNQVVEDAIGDVFVKRAVIPEPLQIHLE